MSRLDQAPWSRKIVDFRKLTYRSAFLTFSLSHFPAFNLTPIAPLGLWGVICVR